MNKNQAMEVLGNYNCSVTEYEGDPFIIRSGWESPKDEEFFKLAAIIFSDLEEGVSDEALAEWIKDHEYDGTWDWGFDDEWTTCDECYNAIRTSPNSYSWTPDYWLTDYGDIFCGDCVRTKMAEDYIQFQIEGKGRHASTVLDPEDHSFMPIDAKFENGWHEGMNDDPVKIYEFLTELGYQVVFTLSSSQFYVEFTAYVRHEDESEVTDEEMEELKDRIIRPGSYGTPRDEFKQFPSPADIAKAQLRGER